MVHTSTPQVAEAVAPAVASPPAVEPARAPQAGAGSAVSRAGRGIGAPDPERPQPYLTRVLDHIPGDYGD